MGAHREIALAPTPTYTKVIGRGRPIGIGKVALVPTPVGIAVPHADGSPKLEDGDGGSGNTEVLCRG
jgi:hypothetical protein